MGQFEHKGVIYTHDDVIHIDQMDAEHLILSQPYNFNGIIVPAGFRWDGASSLNTPVGRFIAAKYYKNMKASCIHDYLCGLAKNKKDRAKADCLYFLLKKYVEKDQPWKCTLALWGVNVGAFFGVGNSF